MNAQEARAKADTIYNTNTNFILASIHRQIDAAASRGLFGINIQSLDISTRMALEKQGYKIHYLSDVRESDDYWTISW
jgi:hypothetical protein